MSSLQMVMIGWSIFTQSHLLQLCLLSAISKYIRLSRRKKNHVNTHIILNSFMYQEKNPGTSTFYKLNA